ncbi:MAG: hypothetical protein ABIT82_13745 [Ramlibacter sp.]
MEATDCAIDGTVIWASRADGRTARAGLADTVAASGRGGMARAPAVARLEAVVSALEIDFGVLLTGATLDLAVSDLAAGDFVLVGTKEAFFGAGLVTFGTGFADLAGLAAAFLTGMTFLAGTALGAGALAAGFTGFPGLAEVFLAGAEATPFALAAGLGAGLDAGLVTGLAALAATLVWDFNSCLLANSTRAGNRPAPFDFRCSGDESPSWGGVIP